MFELDLATRRKLHQERLAVVRPLVNITWEHQPGVIYNVGIDRYDMDLLFEPHMVHFPISAVINYDECMAGFENAGDWSVAKFFRYVGDDFSLVVNPELFHDGYITLSLKMVVYEKLFGNFKDADRGIRPLVSQTRGIPSGLTNIGAGVVSEDFYAQEARKYFGTNMKEQTEKPTTATELRIQAERQKTLEYEKEMLRIAYQEKMLRHAQQYGMGTTTLETLGKLYALQEGDKLEVKDNIENDSKVVTVKKKVRSPETKPQDGIFTVWDDIQQQWIEVDEDLPPSRYEGRYVDLKPKKLPLLSKAVPYPPPNRITKPVRNK